MECGRWLSIPDNYNFFIHIVNVYANFQFSFITGTQVSRSLILFQPNLWEFSSGFISQFYFIVFSLKISHEMDDIWALYWIEIEWISPKDCAYILFDLIVVSLVLVDLMRIHKLYLLGQSCKSRLKWWNLLCWLSNYPNILQDDVGKFEIINIWIHSGKSLILYCRIYCWWIS